MDKVVFETEPTAKYANGLQQQPHCKQVYANRNREIETIAWLPNSQIAQQVYIRFL